MFPYNILLNIKSGITPVKSRDSATLFLFNCRRWDYNIDDTYSATYFSASDKTDIDIGTAAVILYPFLHNILIK